MALEGQLFDAAKALFLLSPVAWAALFALRWFVNGAPLRGRRLSEWRDLKWLLLIVTAALPVVIPLCVAPFKCVGLPLSDASWLICRALGFAAFAGLFSSPAYLVLALLALAVLHPAYLSRREYAGRRVGWLAMMGFVGLATGVLHGVIWSDALEYHLGSTASLGFAVAYLLVVGGAPFVGILGWGLYSALQKCGVSWDPHITVR
ncbi:MAG: hypothetical protein AAB152_11975 [Candidatus Coatesbacteria bacterium]